jgi:hypothetical protein
MGAGGNRRFTFDSMAIVVIYLCRIVACFVAEKAFGRKHIYFSLTPPLTSQWLVPSCIYFVLTRSCGNIHHLHVHCGRTAIATAFCDHLLLHIALFLRNICKSFGNVQSEFR